LIVTESGSFASTESKLSDVNLWKTNGCDWDFGFVQALFPVCPAHPCQSEPADPSRAVLITVAASRMAGSRAFHPDRPWIGFARRRDLPENRP
jgi:hypothetical protein